ncbi:hypothetical protein B0H19DRAFT_964477 [Mycena capillaripes]|nr:hypothetical protein B0H19DRAFT_964477 [Mycena capillaripes]
MALAFHAHLTLAGDCYGKTECVAFFHGSGCEPAGELGSYRPTCAGNCFQYSSFDSLSVAGTETLGTGCSIYSDNNYQNQIGDTGNYEGVGAQCINVPGAQSMRCYYDC